ncbi:MAG: hypothetical protein Kow0037_04880 [Calditrichia bacterium]
MIRNLMILTLLIFSWGFAQFPNIRVSDFAITDPEEVCITINPQNPLQLAVGANINYYFISEDGGLNWNTHILYSSFGVWGDPCLVFSPDGSLFYGHLSNPPGPGWLDQIVVQKSTNLGASWNDGAEIGFNNFRDQDKEWIGIDTNPGSPYYQNMYIAWTEFDEYGSNNPQDSTRIRFSRSIDGGLTWSLATTISDRGGDCLDDDNTVEGAVPAVGPNGEIYLSWSGPLGIVFDKSLDGGLTFGNDKVVGPQVAGWGQNVEGIYRCNGLPITLCDVSNSPYRGTIYIVFADQVNSPLDTDVFLYKSTDGGESWSGRIRVNADSSGRHQFFPWATIDPATGALYVVYYDRRNTSGWDTEVWMARSLDGGETFQEFRVSETAFTPNPNIFFGDYIGIAALNGMVYPVWMRMDGVNLSVWCAIVDDTPLLLNTNNPELPEDFRLYQNYPNPFNGQTSIRYYLTKPEVVQLEVFNSLGQKVATLAAGKQAAGEHLVQLNAEGWSSGVYTYRLKTGHGQQSRRLLLLK